MKNWKKKVEKLDDILSSLTISIGGRNVPVDDGFDELKQITEQIRENRNTVYVIGNGASASMASHFSADLAKNGRIHTEVFSDLALITAISNDMGYEEVFAEPLRRRGQKGDLLVAISSSGNSKNLLAAIDEAHSIGMKSVTISAMDSNNPLKSVGNINLHVPAETYGDAESCHAAILHYWIDLILEKE